MNCKKLLTLLLTLCLVIGVLAPAAGAVTLAGNKGHIHSGSDTSSGSWKDLVATKGDKGYQTLRDNQDHVVDRDQLTFVNGLQVPDTTPTTSKKKG